jgi:hypothetical protein
MSKQVRAIEEHIVCEVCGRTMLKGERTEPYLAPSRERKLVCQLCAPRAQQEGWIRESASPATPARPPRPQQSRRLFRLGRRRSALAVPDDDAAGASEGAETDPAPAADSEPAPPFDERPAVLADRAPRRRFLRDPRHVRAVPTNAQLKIERAIELFNSSEHPRTVAGIARTLGTPQVSATTSGESAAEVVLTVAWDISWYQFVVDLSDTSEAVRMEARGQELAELRPEARDWNAQAQADGTLAITPSDSPDGEDGEQVL